MFVHHTTYSEENMRLFNAQLTLLVKTATWWSPIQLQRPTGGCSLVKRLKPFLFWITGAYYYVKFEHIALRHMFDDVKQFVKRPLHIERSQFVRWSLHIDSSEF